MLEALSPIYVTLAVVTVPEIEIWLMVAVMVVRCLLIVAMMVMVMLVP